LTAIYAPATPVESFHSESAPVERVIADLSTRVPAKTWGAFFTFFVAMFSFGLVPIWFWARRWNAFAQTERRDLIALAAWWRQRASPRDAQRLDSAVERLGPHPLLMILPMLICIFIALMMAAMIFDGQSVDQIRDLTYNYDWNQNLRLWWLASPIEQHLHRVWMAGLCFAYGLHWMAVRSHAQGVRALSKAINRIANDGGAPLVSINGGNNSIGWSWIIAALILCGPHAWWGIPLAMAGSKQRRYMTTTSPVARRVLANQLRDASWRMPDQSMARALARRMCPGELCGARLAPQANYCPRCGRAVSAVA
jgi:hypothetical protein